MFLEALLLTSQPLYPPQQGPPNCVAAFEDAEVRDYVSCVEESLWKKERLLYERLHRYEYLLTKDHDRELIEAFAKVQDRWEVYRSLHCRFASWAAAQHVGYSGLRVRADRLVCEWSLVDRRLAEIDSLTALHPDWQP